MVRITGMLLMALIAGCASLPQTENVVGFGTAVSNGVSTIIAIGTENQKISLLADKELEAGRYMCGDGWEGLTEPKSSIDPRAIAFRVKRLQALAAYASALKDASDSASIDKLVEAANNLITTAASLVATAAPAAAPLATPLGKIVGKSAGLTIKDGYARKVSAVITETDPAVQKLVLQLTSDMGKVEDSSNATLFVYSTSVDVNLENMRIKEVLVKAEGEGEAKSYRCLGRFPKGAVVEKVYREDQDRGLAHDRLIKAIDDKIAAKAAINAADRSKEVLSKIASTHHSLAEQSPHATSNVRELISMSDALAELIKAAKETN